jgi:rubrerythrin
MSALTATTTAAVAATPALTVEALISVLRAASADQMSELLTELNRGMPLWRSPEEGKATSARAKMAARAAAAAALLPEAADGEAPAVSAYRVSAADIDHTVCVGRRLADSTKDTRWKPAVYREFQCGKELSDEEESDLCPTCSARKTRYDAAPGPKVEWMGRITEEPLGWLHMLGTDWAPRAPSGSAVTVALTLRPWRPAVLVPLSR